MCGLEELPDTSNQASGELAVHGVSIGLQLVAELESLGATREDFTRLGRAVSEKRETRSAQVCREAFRKAARLILDEARTSEGPRLFGEPCDEHGHHRPCGGKCAQCTTHATSGASV